MFDQSVGEFFLEEKLLSARDKTLDVIQSLSSEIKVGMTESMAQRKLIEIQKLLGVPQSWHPPKIRFGKNTLCSFKQESDQNVVLQENDIYFIDLGVLFEKHEGDVGRTYTLGNDPDMISCAKDVEVIWQKVRNYWSQHNITGPDLYKYAQQITKAMGWELSLEKADGHRISDFPHMAKGRGSIIDHNERLLPNRWILEIQIRHPSRDFGAFYEDIL